MKALILAAGLGNRLRPLTETIPKSMVSVNGIPMIDRMIDRLEEAGINEIVVVSGYLSSVLKEHLANSSSKAAQRAEVVFNDRYSDWGNFYSVLVAKEKLAGSSFIKLDGDVVLDGNVLPKILEKDADLVLALDRSLANAGTIGAEEMKITCDEDGKVNRISKEIDPTKAEGESIGIEKIRASASESFFLALEQMISDGETHDFYENAYQRMLDDGATFQIADITDYSWCEIDTSEDLHYAMQLAS